MKTIVVLGMHRSAASLIAKGLSGVVHMGNSRLGPSAGNPEGHYENIEFLELNQKMLKSADGSWNRPRSREEILGVRNRFDKQIKQLVDSSSEGKTLWSWKEPRTTLTIELYLPQLVNPHFVCCFREPEKVATSLTKRDAKLDINFESSMVLAKIYNERLLDFCSRIVNSSRELN
jgi:hypothetical protein